MTDQVAFPADFLWGTASAAHQVEGGNVNSDCWVLEHVPGTPWIEPSGDACDHYHRYEQDIALLAELGFNTYRFSIEWARIEPEEGEFSVAALDHYRRMLDACHAHGLTPIVTYHHFTSPRWFAARGGWEVMENVDLFARFCGRSTAHLGDLIGAACTLNEPNVGLLLQALGFWPADDEIATMPLRVAAARAVGAETFGSFHTARQDLAAPVYIAAHRQAVAAIKAEAGTFPVGMTLALQEYQAVTGGEAERDRIHGEVDGPFLAAARGDDFLGVQTYSRIRVGPEGVLDNEPGVELTMMDYEFWPEALEATIRSAAAETGIPIIVTENGVATEDDTRRVEYIRRALDGVRRCLADGIPVRGYCYWSIFDNFEWMLGYRPTFGLIAVDRATQERTVKPSARWLGEVARANGAVPS
ncbi:MAG: glycoside hydrolase family 1 protein [Thermomicrobiales bacterium]